MGILDNVERGLERAVNGAFARTFRSGVQTVEIASALKRELDIGAVVVDRDRVLAPNRFVVRVSPDDAGRLDALGDTLERELVGVVDKHVKRQGYQLAGAADVELRPDESLTKGVLQVDATRVDGAVAWTPVLVVDGKRHPLRKGSNIVGRGSDAAIRIGDSAASRQHLDVLWDGKAGLARDLGSTNGSKINGQRFREAALAPQTTITIGQTHLRFELVPTRAAEPSRAAQPGGSQGARPGEARGRSSPSQPGAGIEQDFWRGL